MQVFRSRSWRNLFGIVGMVLLCSIFCISESTAAIPRKISYQGVLTDSNGTPLSGQYQMRFQIYTSASGGTALWTEEWKDSSKVIVSNGLFNVLLGSIQPIDLGTLTFVDTYWLEVAVDHSGSYEILTPRHELASAAYALRAATVENGAIGASALASNSVTADKIGDGQITDGKVASLSATKITTGTIANDRINWAAPGSIGTSTAGVGYFTNLFANGVLKFTDSGGTPYTDNWIGRFNDGSVDWLHIGGITTGGVRRIGFWANTVYASGNVGIGTTSPGRQLTLSSSSADTYFRIENKASGGRGWALISSGSGSGHPAGSFAIFDDYLLACRLLIDASGNIGIGKTPGYKLDVAGIIRGENYSCPNGDIAEKLIVHPDYELSSKELKDKVSKLSLPDAEKKAMIERKEISKLEPGTVVVISKDGVIPCAKENDTHLAGIISTSPAVKMASEEKGQYIALAGKVPCKVIGKIKAGDMLTTSMIEGHAQKVEQPILGAVVGKALEDFEGAKGVVNVWVGGM